MGSLVTNTIHQLATHRLSRTDALAVANALFGGNIPDTETQELLAQLHQSPGETTDELLGFITAMRQNMTPIHLQSAQPLIDLCGTGGSLPNRFNVSSCVAMILGSAGYPVAKHGNRGSKAPNGSFDFLAALGIPYELSEEAHQHQLNTLGCTFLFARTYHPAVRHVTRARQQLGHASIFNLIGPFCNPASPPIHVIGCPSHALADRLLAVGQALPYQTLAFISNDMGLDECTTTGPSRLMIWKNNQLRTHIITPKEWGIQHTLNDISVSKNALGIDNARQFKILIHTKNATHPISELIALNAAVVMHVANPEQSISDGLEMALSIIKTGKLQSFIPSPD